MYESILVPTDGSDHAERAYERGLALAAATGADLHVQHVVDTKRHAETALSGSQLLVADAETAGQHVLKRYATRAREAGVPVMTRSCHGDPGREILDYADANDVDVVVMGYQGEDHKRSLGSTTSRVVRSMDRPVMLV